MEERQEKCRIAILDNCMIEVMIRLQERGFPIKKQLQSYDCILIPGWVWVEVCDSAYRKRFIHEIEQEGCIVEIVEEREYEKIVSQELLLLRVFKMSIRPYAQLKACFHKEVLEGRDEADIDYWYTEWIDRMYQFWPFKERIITNSDGEERCQKLDVLLKEAYQQHVFDAEKIFSVIDEIRTDRESTYLVKKKDSSIESHRENVDNIKFKEIVLDDDSMIIW